MSRTPPAGIAFLVGLASCTSLPTPAEMLAIGYRSPEQCFETFQTAVRADEPALEYSCFSQHFRSANRVSQLVWREVREQLWGQVGVQKETVLGAKRSLVTVEEIVDELTPVAGAVVLPGWAVTRVAHVPGGAHPSYAMGYSDRDNDYYQAWDRISRDRDAFGQWLAGVTAS